MPRLPLLVLVLFLSALTSNFAAASVTIWHNVPLDPGIPDEVDFSVFDTVQFDIGYKDLYRPSGSRPADPYGLGNASVSSSFTANLDAPLSLINYQGVNSLYTEISGNIEIWGLNGTSGNTNFPIHAALILSPAAQGTTLFVKPISASGAVPRDFNWTVSVSSRGRSETGNADLWAQFNTEGGRSTYAYDYNKLAAGDTLRVLTEITSSQRISTWALTVERINVGSEMYLTDRPGAASSLSVYYSSNPVSVPEPSTLLLCALIGLRLAGRRRTMGYRS